MKKIRLVLSVFVLVIGFATTFCLSACGKKGKADNKTNANVTTTTKATTTKVPTTKVATTTKATTKVATTTKATTKVATTTKATTKVATTTNATTKKEKTVANASFASSYDPSKTYDGTKVAAPGTSDYTTNSDGAATVEWYTSSNVLLESAPENAGDYKVRLSIAATADKTATTTEYKAFTIAKKELKNVSTSKVYDGTIDGSYTFTTTDGVVGSDVVTCTFTYDVKDFDGSLGTDPVLGGADASNYEVDVDTFEASITKKMLKNLNFNINYYGGNKGYCVLDTTHGVVKVNGTEDDVDCILAFSDISAGSQAVSGELCGDDAGNYLIDMNTLGGSILKKVLKNINYTREYDGTTIGNFTLKSENGIIGSDVVTCTFDYDSKNAGTRTASNFVIGGANGGNYEIDSATFNAQIRKKIIDTTINTSRFYDGTNTGERYLNSTNGVYSGDVVKIDFTYADKNVGSDKEGTIQSITGTDKDNYDLSGVEIIGAIVKKQINNITAVSNKQYDGTVTGRYDLTTTNGKIAGDELYYGFNYSDETVNSFFENGMKILKGADKNNYSVSGITLTGKINKKVLQTTTADKVYDGNVNGSYTFVTADGVVGSEVVSCTFTYDSKNAGTRTGSNFVIAGANAGNYEIGSLAGEITKKELTSLHLATLDNGTAGRTITLNTLSGIVGTDSVSIVIDSQSGYDTYWETGSTIDLVIEASNYGEEKATLIGTDSDNYELVLDDSGRVGILTIFAVE